MRRARTDRPTLVGLFSLYVEGWISGMGDKNTETRHDGTGGWSVRGDAADGMTNPLDWTPFRLRLQRWGSRLTPWWRDLIRWRHIVLPLLLIAVALGLYLPRFDYPEKYLFDELLFAYTAGEYVDGNPDAFLWDHPCSVTNSDAGCLEVNPEADDTPTERVGKYQWAHPPLGKYFIAMGIILFGNDSFGWRIPSVVAGAIGIFLAYRLGLVLTGRQSVGVLTAGLLLLDGLYFVYSRLGLVDIFLTVIMMGAMLAFTNYLQAPSDRIQWPLFTTGLLLGMGIATKWSAAYAAGFIGLFALWRLLRLFRASRREDATPETTRGFRAHLIWIPLALGAVPASVY